ncbi:MAG: cbb3-type cytochrome c oxidase N-terminal domain-containing protein, partial [Moraxella sp.]|nr:cbb3-type cytochrome c oxidase N-terminal domain-containing protein [Moraxella sp.]
MSFFWSSWITVFSLACWLFIFVILVWVVKYRPVLEEDETTGHSYDGIREYDKPLPKWWLVVFFATMFWGLGYFVFFPSIQPAQLKGIATVEVDGQQVPWTSANELNSQLQQNNAVFVQNFESVLSNAGASDALPMLADLHSLQAKNKAAAEPDPELQKQIDEKVAALAPYVDKLAANPEAQLMGNRLFLQNCALCHGSNAKGSKGYPNLTDNDWLYGGNADNILLSIHNGRVGGMAAWRGQIGEAGVRAAAEYVMSISGNIHGDTLDSTLVTQGEAIFKQNCVLCHGQDAEGLA